MAGPRNMSILQGKDQAAPAPATTNTAAAATLRAILKFNARAPSGPIAAARTDLLGTITIDSFSGRHNSLTAPVPATPRWPYLTTTIPVILSFSCGRQRYL